MLVVVVGAVAVGLLQTAHYWANAGVLVVVGMRCGVGFVTINLC